MLHFSWTMFIFQKNMSLEALFKELLNAFTWKDYLQSWVVIWFLCQLASMSLPSDQSHLSSYNELFDVFSPYAATKDTSPSLAISLNHIISCFVTVKRLSWKSLRLCLGIHLWPNSFLICLLFFPDSWQTDSRTWAVPSKYCHVIL